MATINSTSWSDVKSFIDERVVSPQWIALGDKYVVFASDGVFGLQCNILITDPAGDDQSDFEQNYKPNGNKSDRTEVVTQYEKNDKDLKLASGESPFDVNGLAQITIKVPKTGRWVAGGYSFTDRWTKGDRLTKVEVIDIDGIMAPPQTVVKTYYDDEVDPQFQGWRMWQMPNLGGEVEVEPIGGYGFLPGGLYLRVTFQCAPNVAAWVCADIWWGKGE